MLPVAGPSITQKEIDYVTDAVTNAWFGNANMYHERFEKAFAEYVGTEFAISLPSCTSALHLSLAALDIGPGDEVIVPDITWIATSAPIDYVGATAVFADVDDASWCISVDSVRECITDRTKAIIAVDIYGGMPEWDELLEFAASRGIPVIEDSAEASGSEYKGRRAGSLGITGTFSFHGSKTMTTGEGGMLVTSDSKLRDRMLFLRDHGRPPGDRFFFNTEVAFKYKMSSMQAALGLAQLERLDELVDRKREIFSWYQARLAGKPGLAINHEPAGVKNSYWMSSVVWDDGPEKKELMAALRERDIDSRPFFHPLSSIPAYHDRAGSAAARGRNKVSARLGQRSLNLPSALSLTEDQVDHVCSSFCDILGI